MHWWSWLVFAYVEVAILITLRQLQLLRPVRHLFLYESFRQKLYRNTITYYVAVLWFPYVVWTGISTLWNDLHPEADNGSQYVPEVGNENGNLSGQG